MDKVYQDGADFYAIGKGKIFTAKIRVPDFDMDAAILARSEFIKWAEATHLDYMWEN